MPSGRTLALIASSGSLLISIAYAWQREWRLALYWFFAACIGFTMSW